MHILTTITTWVRAHAKPFGAGCIAMIAILFCVATLFQPASRPQVTQALAGAATPVAATNVQSSKFQRLGFADTWLQQVQRNDDAGSAPTQARSVQIGMGSPGTLASPVATASAVEMATRFASSNELQPISSRAADPYDANALTSPTLAVASASAPNPISARLDLARNRFGKVRSPFPFQVENYGATSARGTIVVGQLPEGASFTSGTRTSEGAWHLAIHDLNSTQLVVGPSAPNSFMMSIIQLDPAGMVVNGIGIAVFLSNSEPLTVATQVRQTLSKRTKITTAGRYRAPRLVIAAPPRKLPPLQGVTRPITASTVAATPLAALPAQINQASPWPVPTLVPAPVAPAPREVTDRSLNPIYPFTDGPKPKPQP
jgi:hypothetical protein